MSTKKRGYNTSDESASSSSTKYSMRSFSTAATSPPRGPDPEDSGWWASNRTYVIRADDAIVKPWNEDGLCEAVMSEVQTLSDWVSVDVFRRGLSVIASECPPTVVISVVPGKMDENWRIIVGKIKALLERYELDAAVEVVESIVTRYQTLKDDPEKSAGIGASLAREGGATGTLGGYVQLNRPGLAPKICALTCHHVVASSDVSPKDVYEYGLSPIDLEPSDFRMESPSETDLRDTLENRINFRKDRLDILNETRRQIKEGIASEGRTRRLGGDKINWKRAAKSVSNLQTLDRQLGRVVASSGLRIGRTRCSLDWGLVEVAKERLAGNLLKEVEGQFRGDADYVEQVCEIEDGKIVSKFGRTTEFTNGKRSFIDSHVTWPDSPHVTTEHVFISSEGFGKRFSSTGDSGAWVFNSKGHLGGMVVGGHLQNPWSYVTPISVIFEDIETRLDCKVTLVDGKVSDTVS